MISVNAQGSLTLDQLWKKLMRNKEVLRWLGNPLDGDARLTLGFHVAEITPGYKFLSLIVKTTTKHKLTSRKESSLAALRELVLYASDTLCGVVVNSTGGKYS